MASDPATTACTLPATSSLATEVSLARKVVCPAVAVSRCPIPANCRDEDASTAAFSAICSMLDRRFFTMALMSLCNAAKSPWCSPSSSAVRSPAATFPITAALRLSGPTTASMAWLTPSTIRRKSPPCCEASTRVASCPAMAALHNWCASRTSASTAPINIFRLRLISLKSPR